jgi:hypothetical protein
MSNEFERYPQAGHVAALVDRCKALTSQEAELLATSWHDTWIDPDLWPATGWRKLLGWRKRKAVTGDVTARMVARARAGRAALDADRDTRALILEVDGVVRRAARHLGVRTEAAAAHAAKDAARALAARDLISTIEGEWGQAEYDLLTWPWRSIIGPVHPHDPR